MFLLNREIFSITELPGPTFYYVNVLNRKSAIFQHYYNNNNNIKKPISVT